MKNKHKAIVLIVITLGLLIFFYSILEEKQRVVMSLAYLYGIYYAKLLNYFDNEK